jgi:hypothetical protein
MCRTRHRGFRRERELVVVLDDFEEPGMAQDAGEIECKWFLASNKVLVTQPGPQFFHRTQAGREFFQAWTA